MNDPGEDNPFHHLNLSLDLHTYFSSKLIPTDKSQACHTRPRML